MPQSNAPLPAWTPPKSHTTPKSQLPPPRKRSRFLGTFTPRTVAAPLAAFTMAIILYTYSVSSINAAKRNAALHRAADGGQLDMRRESLRRHGMLERVEGTRMGELYRASGGQVNDNGLQGRGDGSGSNRTGVEEELEGWKGREGVERRMKGPPPGLPGAEAQATLPGTKH
ncbi:uncharacterized protein AB675_3654 [Cyphellophora attinorum]|uniref:Uncharacterized protein n=1 Tax=Cyphellophora attinorum TaxID=1664694 RepID=A0A0N0NJK9_9EURO|nr:uncharacterized protein AB675_3654 [Phialophora attinorum]KPI37018.1 hypothetical protein AB675_3654 [Phialophora attinorum]